MMPQRPAYPTWFGNNPIPAPGIPGPGQGVYTGGMIQPMPVQLGQVSNPSTTTTRATGLTRARQVAAPQARIPTRTTNTNRPTSPLAKSLSRGKPKPRTY